MDPAIGTREKLGGNLPFDQEGQRTELTTGYQVDAAPGQLCAVWTPPASLHQVAFGQVESAGLQVGERSLEVLCARCPGGERATGFEGTPNAQRGRMSLRLSLVDDCDQLQVAATQGDNGVAGSTARVAPSRDREKTVVPCESIRGLVQIRDRDLYVVELESRAARRGAALEPLRNGYSGCGGVRRRGDRGVRVLLVDCVLLRVERRRVPVVVEEVAAVRRRRGVVVPLTAL
jgi:hypothetical protein